MSEMTAGTSETNAAELPANAVDDQLEMPTMRVRHLWHRYGNIDVLKDVTFDVWPGEIFGFIGPNGAGKTTTIRIMATLLEPMAGRVEIDGIDVTIDPASVRKRIGYMPDHAGVYDRVTVREYLEFFADAYRVPSADVVDAVLELADLGKIQDRLVATMSKGMKQRLQIARVLLHDPKVLIMDEPASDLDPRARIEIRDLLLELRSLGKTIFLSSHILTELSDVCTSIGILERGRLVVAGPIGEIAARLEAMRAGQQVPQGHPHASYYPQQAGHSARAQRYAQVAHHRPYGPAVQSHPSYPYAQHPQAPAGQHAPAPQQFGQYAQPPPGYSPGPPPPQTPDAYPPPGQQAPPPQTQPAPVLAKRRVKVRVLGNPDLAAPLLRGGPGILGADVIAGVIHVSFTGNDVKIAEIVQHLVRNGVGVVGVEQERNELERIFLEVTKGEMQ